MSSPGWYPDPQDPNSLRYFDGQAWTEHQQPSGAAGSAAQAGQQSPQQPYQTQQYPPAQEAYPPAQYASGQLAYQAGQPPYPPQAASGGKRGKKLPVIIGLVVVVVAGLLTGGYFLFFNKSDSPAYTYAGKEIKDPAVALDTAEKNLAALVKDRHGVLSKQSHCYYAMPTDPQNGKKSDIAREIYCGPVLFVDGDPSQVYLKYTVTPTEDGSNVTLTPSAQPVSKDPTSVPKTVTLKRPDGAEPPAGAGGLKPPAPPAAEANVVVATQITDATVPAAPKGAVIGSWSGGVKLTKLGPVSRYGHGDDARSAPAGGKLIAFQATGGPDENGSIHDLTSQAKISIDGGPGKPVPSLSGGDYVVVSVPAGAKSVDLVLNDEGLTQSLSLLDGTPGKNNVVLFTRGNKDMNAPVRGNATFTFSPKVKFSDGTGGASETATVTVNVANLMYKSPANEKPLTASSPSAALLHVSVTYSGKHDPGPFGFPPELLTFTPNGGKAVRAQNLAMTSGKIYNVFQVPANMTSGTLTISGSVKQSFSDGKGSYTWGIKSPVRIALPIPLSD